MGAAGTKETMDINLVKHDGDVETGGVKISINKDKNDATNTNENSDSDVERPSLINRLSIRKTEVSQAIEEKERIRFGKYIIAWRTFPFRMSVALIVEFAIGFLAILSAKGDFQVLPTIVSMLYLLYLFSSSATQNTIGDISDGISSLKEWMKDEGYVGTVLYSLYVVILCSFFMPILVVLDLVNIHKECIGPHNLSFAAADTVTIIASINYASRATELSVAVPLLVSFDFLTKFSAKIIDSITCDEIKAEQAAKSYDKSVSSFLFVLMFVLGIVLTAVILACLSIGF